MLTSCGFTRLSADRITTAYRIGNAVFELVVNLPPTVDALLARHTAMKASFAKDPSVISRAATARAHGQFGAKHACDTGGQRVTVLVIGS